MEMYLFSHYLQSILLPPGINLLLMFSGIFIRFIFRRIGNLIALVGLITLGLWSMPFVAYQWVDVFQNQYMMLTPSDLASQKSNDAILVLGGGDTVAVEYGYRHVPSDYTRHRLQYAAYLHQKTHLPIIVSGGKVKGAIHSEADLMAEYLWQHDRIKVLAKEDRSMTTAEESQFLVPILKSHHIHQVYLVTHAWHMPRSVYIFGCRNIAVTPAPMGYYFYGPGYAFISFLPNILALQASSVAMHEWIGMIWYYLRYHQYCEMKK